VGRRPLDAVTQSHLSATYSSSCRPSPLGSALRFGRSYANIDIETVDFDVKYIMREMNSNIKKYLEKENNASNYPGGLNEVNFLIAFSEKIKKYERMTNYHPEFVSWTDNFYKKIDDDLSKENYKGLTSLWKSFLKEAKLKIEEINEQQ
jgi:hypothetical protein